MVKLFHFFVAGILSALGLFAGGLMAWRSSVYHRRWSRRNLPDWKKGSIRRAPPPEAYSRVTNPERFRVLHATMTDTLAYLKEAFDVQQEEGYGLDEEMERGLELDRPSVRLTPTDPEAAPLMVAFSTFPGLSLRFGRWWNELLPACGCDACADTGDELAQELNWLIENVVAGRFRESHDGWKVWGEDGSSRGRGKCSNSDLSEHGSMNWKPWPKHPDR